MTKEECKMKLKHQLKIGRRLQEVGLYAAATASRNKAQTLLHTYKRHFGKSVKHHYRTSHVPQRHITLASLLAFHRADNHSKPS